MTNRHMIWVAVTLLSVFAVEAGVASAEGPEVRVNIGLTSPRTVGRLKADLEKGGGTEILENPSINVFTYSIPEGMFESLGSTLRAAGGIAFIEKDLLRKIPPVRSSMEADSTPSDPEYSKQWGPRCIGAEQAWDYPALYDHPPMASQWAEARTHVMAILGEVRGSPVAICRPS